MAMAFKCVLIALVIHLLGGHSSHTYQHDFDIISDSDKRHVFWRTQQRLSKRSSTDEQNIGIGVVTDDTNQKEVDKEIKTLDKDGADNSKNSTLKTVSVNTTAANETADFKIKSITKTKLVADNISPPQVDLSNPGVLKRGIIVFGGFALLAIAYFLFYRGKNVKNENLNIHNTTDGPQFRYGVLQSDDKKDNLSRMPLTMESDEDEEDDLEVFDIEQKKKSLSYVNLQSRMEDVENFSTPTDNPFNDNERNTLLLDIDDRIPDNLINLTNSNHKSIL